MSIYQPSIMMVGIFMRKSRNHMENIIDRNIFLRSEDEDNK